MTTRFTSQVRTPGRAAFTLIELLVVIAIMAILASLVTISLVNKPGEARVIATGIEIKTLQGAVKMYHVEQGHIPTMDQGLLALVERPVLAPVPERYPQDGYLDGLTVPNDPWGNTYIYLVPGRSGESFEIISYGSDGEPGGSGDAADISSSDPRQS